ncbi:hypothetical protein HOI18_04810 [Candidatus Uhrbacteria bacterium]|jgi:hypothetical protein|nr:hypothetical protein [Candidatus Uhrbacteria bacterium]
MAIESKMNRGPIGRSSKKEVNKSGNWNWIIILFIIAIAGGGWYYFSSDDGTVDQTDSGSGGISISTGEYQAVFLDNGQVYFGELNQNRGQFYTLTDVFYLQSGAAGIDQVSSLSLTKLGNEAHGPEDRMEINVEHILFIEDMKGDSKVVQAINDYKTSN